MSEHIATKEELCDEIWNHVASNWMRERPVNIMYLQGLCALLFPDLMRELTKKVDALIDSTSVTPTGTHAEIMQRLSAFQTELQNLTKFN